MRKTATRTRKLATLEDYKLALGYIAQSAQLLNLRNAMRDLQHSIDKAGAALGLPPGVAVDFNGSDTFTYQVAAADDAPAKEG
ncbi:MAG: hypothetical protein JXQ29_08415 [Planctomycetes bacterium]|nr:hypothetical protein [Planctomycetota bacterium]